MKTYRWQVIHHKNCISREVGLKKKNKKKNKKQNESKTSLAPTCGVIILNNDEENRKQEICTVCTSFSCINSLYNQAQPVSLDVTPRKQDFEHECQSNIVPSKCAHTHREN